jgi:hypothetical protein
MQWRWAAAELDVLVEDVEGLVAAQELQEELNVVARQYVNARTPAAGGIRGAGQPALPSCGLSASLRAAWCGAIFEPFNSSR